MAVGKISELVDDSALAQLDALLQKLGISTQAMIDATAAAAKFNNEIGGVKTLTDFTQASQQAITALQGVKDAQQQVSVVQQQANTETQKLVDQIKTKAIADENASTVLKNVSGALETNIKFLVEQKVELKQVSDTLKELSKQEAVSAAGKQQVIQKTVELTQKQLQLKDSTSQLSLLIKQQVKDNQSTVGSQDQMLARLNQLRKAYNSLSTEERNNAEIGGVLKRNIDELATSTTKINQEQHKYNDSVGNYENAIKSAISQYVPFGAQLVQGVDTLKNVTSATEEGGFSLKKLGLGFAGFTIGAFAIAMAAAVDYLSQFRQGSAKVQEGLGILKQQFFELGEVVTGNKKLKDFSLGDAAKTGIQIANLKIQAKYENELTETVVKQMQAEADQDRARSKNRTLDITEREAYLKKALSIEDQIIQKQTDNADLQVELALKVANKAGKLNPVTLRRLGEGQGDISEANYLANTGKITQEGFEMYKAALDKRTEALQAATMKEIRQENDAANIQLRADNSLQLARLALLKARLQGEKETAKLILDDVKQSYEARLAALKIYTDRANKIIDTQREIEILNGPSAKSGKDARLTQIAAKTANQTATNEKLGVDAFDLSERQKIQKEAIAEFKKLTHDLNVEVTDDLKESLNQQQIAVEKDAAYKIDVLTDQFTAQKIKVDEYNRKIKIINDKANEEKLQAEIDTYKQILAIQVGFEAAQATTGLPLSVATPAQIQGTKDKIATSETGLVKAKTQTKIDSAKDDDKTKKDKIKEFADAIGYLQQVQDDASKIVQQNYENEIAVLEKRKQIIQDTADAETTRVQNSVLSSKEKAREEAVIREQAKQQQLQVDAQISRIKERQAKYDRALSIANIIENTAVGIAKATGSIFGLPLVPIIAALGAAQLATVLATPLPKFEKGTKSSPEGFAHVGEAGTELMIDPSGRMALTPSTDTITYLQKGTQIISNKELQRIVGKPEPVYYISDTRVDNRKLEKLMAENNQLQKNRREKIIINTGDRFGDYSRRRNY